MFTIITADYNKLEPPRTAPHRGNLCKPDGICQCSNISSQVAIRYKRAGHESDKSYYILLSISDDPCYNCPLVAGKASAMLSADPLTDQLLPSINTNLLHLNNDAICCGSLFCVCMMNIHLVR